MNGSFRCALISVNKTLPSTGSWYRINSSSSQFIAAQFGANGDKAVPAAHLP
ncbi:MAG TPA: hypothetical protein VGB00_14995 [Pyrinomonadaceae bacterium]|jgi:hypothetical protein